LLLAMIYENKDIYTKNGMFDCSHRVYNKSNVPTCYIIIN
jgi:hypothetical protein